MAVKSLELTIQATRTNPVTNEQETQERNLSIPESYFISQLLARYPVLESVDTVQITGATWVTATQIENGE